MCNRAGLYQLPHLRVRHWRFWFVWLRCRLCRVCVWRLRLCLRTVILWLVLSFRFWAHGRMLTRLFWYPSEKFARALAKTTYQEILFGFFDISDSVSQTVTPASLGFSAGWCSRSWGLTVISTEGVITAAWSREVEILDQWLDLPSYTCWWSMSLSGLLNLAGSTFLGRRLPEPMGFAHLARQLRGDQKDEDYHLETKLQTPTLILSLVWLIDSMLSDIKDEQGWRQRGCEDGYWRRSNADEEPDERLATIAQLWCLYLQSLEEIIMVENPICWGSKVTESIFSWTC